MIALEHRANGMDVTFCDANVSRVSLSDRMLLDVTDRDRDELRVVLSAPLEVVLARGTTWSVAIERSDERLARLAFALRHTWLLTCSVDTHGSLSMVFEAGMLVRVAPRPDDEAWRLVHDRFELVGMAGGELAMLT